MKKCIFKGVGTAIVTPFKNGKIDLVSFITMLERQINANVKAVIVLGTTGEPCTITNDERVQIIKTAILVCKDKCKVIVGCGSNDIIKAIEYYKQATTLGSDGALIVTPYYNKCTNKGLIEYYSAIAKSGKLPIIVYNVPSRTGVNINTEVMQDLIKIPNICGIKEASGNIVQIIDFFAKFGHKIAIYSGEDGLNNIFASLGGLGCISVASNIIPKTLVKMFDYGFNKDFIRMNSLHYKMLPLIKNLFTEVNPIPVKAGLWHLGLCRNEFRLPLTKMSDEKFLLLKEQLELIYNKELNL